MTYQRYVIAPTGSTGLHDMCFSLSHLWENGDGTSLFKVQSDDVQFIALNAMEGVIVLPSLNAPAERHGTTTKKHFEDQGVSVEPGDTTLNMLRKLRNMKSMDHILIDHPF